MALNVETCTVLNVDNGESTLSADKIFENTDNGSFIVSDADEELLMLIEFKKVSPVQNITFYASKNVMSADDTDISAPKLVSIYKTKHLNINFDVIASIKADKTIKLSVNELNKGQLIKLNNNIRFKYVKYLVIYIQTNQSNTENTYLNGISLNTVNDNKQYDVEQINNTLNIDEEHEEHEEHKSSVSVHVDNDNKWQIFKRIDNLIGQYYQSFGINNYFNVNNLGLFMQYIIDEELNDDDISIDGELGDDVLPSECIYTQFDLNRFPISNDINYNEDDKQNIAFYILQYCYKYNSLPDSQYIKQKLQNASNEGRCSLCANYRKIGKKVELYNICNDCIGKIKVGKINLVEGNKNVIYVIDVKTIVITLSVLSVQDRERGLKLMHKIINNILSNPNEAKYQRLDIRNLSKKLVAHQLWFELLSKSGFSESNDGNKLIFDTMKLKELKSVYNLLSTNKWDTNTKINDDEKWIEFDERLINKESNCRLINKEWKCSNCTLIQTSDNTQCEACGYIKDSWSCPSCTYIQSTENTICELCGYQCTMSESQQVAHQQCIISSCNHLRRLSVAMRKYNDAEHGNMENENTLQIVNDYIHLIHDHDKDDDFGRIVNEFGCCDIMKCTMFKRNNRDKIAMNMNEMKNIDKSEVNDRIYYEIMDKIHCYFMHCYHVGNRLSAKDRKRINYKPDDNKDDENDIYLTNKQIMAINKILKSKREIFNDIDSNKRMNQKFNQIAPAFEEKIDENNKMYSFGYRFYYGYNKETTNGLPVFPKYGSLKEELISNAIAILSIDQFNSEQKKAQIHFDSYYCRQTYRPFVPQRIKIIGHIAIECLLSLMIYCNYDRLQYEFSKTYRENNGNNHNEFYWLGRYLKISIRKFGTNIVQGNITKFYHGINDALIFPDYIEGIQIHCPLSTSSSFEVAANFTNDNNGIIIQFASNFEGVDEKKYFPPTPRYFSVSWLSQYGNEKEYLFIQNVLCFKINDIINTGLGIKYYTILRALQYINMLLCSYYDGDRVSNDIRRDISILSATPYQLLYVINKNETMNIADSMKLLMRQIILDQLSVNIAKYKSFKSINQYARSICDTFFKNKKFVEIDYLYCKANSSFITQLIFDSKNEWINTNLLFTLFPKTRVIKIKNINLNSSIIEDILNAVDTLNTISICWWVWITPHKNSELSAEEVINKYHALFSKMSVFISANLYDNELYIARTNDIRFELTKIGQIFPFLGQRYFKDTHDQTAILMTKLMTTELTNKSEAANNMNANNMNQSHDQQLFHQYCMAQTSITIDWRNIVSNTKLGAFKLFYHSQYQWIKIDIITALFSNTTSLTIKHIRFSPWIFDNIFKHLNEKNTKLISITLRLGDGKVNAYRYRKSYPNKLETQMLWAELDEIGLIDFNNHSMGFKEFYQSRDNIETVYNNNKNKDEKLYLIDFLIAAKAKVEYGTRFKEIGFNMVIPTNCDSIVIKKD